MNIDVNPDWWKTMFDEVYLLTDARSVCNPELTRREIDLVFELLPMDRKHRILDLCAGHGRHSFELGARGFKNCTVLDYSLALIDCAKVEAAACNLPIDFVCCDARSTALPSESFDHVLIMGNSLGYISSPDADHHILLEAHRVLRHGGWLLTDVTDGTVVKKSFTPCSWHEIGDDTVVCRQRELRKETIAAREMVISKTKGLIRDRNYAVRLYEPETMTSLLTKSGFKQISVKTDFSPQQIKGDYGFMNHRMITTGRKL